MSGKAVSRGVEGSKVSSAGELALTSFQPPSSQQGAQAMPGEPLRRKVLIVNPNGFHVRPAAAFAEVAGRFQCQVTLVNGDRRVDGRRVLDLIMLGAEAGTEVTIEVAGPDAAEAVEALAQVLGAREPPLPPAQPPPPKG